MALQNSGTLTLNEIAAEFGGTAPHGLKEYYGAASGVPSSGTISILDFYGTADETTLTSAGTVNGEDQRKQITASSFISSGETLVIPSGLWVWSDATNTAALTVDIPCTIKNYGKIIGRGGDGNGNNGGNAVRITSSGVTITNYSGAYIAGGGGGGGGIVGAGGAGGGNGAGSGGYFGSSLTNATPYYYNTASMSGADYYWSVYSNIDAVFIYWNDGNPSYYVAGDKNQTIYIAPDGYTYERGDYVEPISGGTYQFYKIRRGTINVLNEGAPINGATSGGSTSSDGQVTQWGSAGAGGGGGVDAPSHREPGGGGGRVLPGTGGTGVDFSTYSGGDGGSAGSAGSNGSTYGSGGGGGWGASGGNSGGSGGSAISATTSYTLSNSGIIYGST